MSGVTAEQIARSPEATRRRAVQRVSGVTIQDGKNVSVRASASGIPNDAERCAAAESGSRERIVPFDLFPRDFSRRSHFEDFHPRSRR